MPFTLAFIHTSPILVSTFSNLARQELDGVRFFHMVDESLLQNTIAEGQLTKNTIHRLVNLIGSAHEGGGDAVMVTCSSIGAAIPVARSVYDFPILRVDEPMAENAVEAGKRIGVAATLKTTLRPTVDLLKEKAAERKRNIEVAERLCEGAFERVTAGDTESHDRIVSEALMSLAKEVDAIVLAQASMARVANQLAADVVRIPVLSSPELAVKQVREFIHR